VRRQIESSAFPEQPEVTAPGHSFELRLPPVKLEAMLDLPPGCGAVVIFAHGSGSSRFSPRNVHVARALREAGLGTLLFDLLTAEESADRRNVFDIALLADRLAAAADWLRTNSLTRPLLLGYFGASTGAAAALVAAARPGSVVAAIVSRGGRPDLAGSALPKVRAPTQLIVGERDSEVLQLNRMAFAELRCKKELAIVPGATHLFEEPGTLDVAVDHARRWFSQHLGVRRNGQPGHV
jgi:putative phosphoribosyl transferase